MTVHGLATSQGATERFEAFHELLPALASTLDVNEMFQHLSRVAARVIPHDEANLALLTDDGARFRGYVAAADGRRVGAREVRCPLRNLIEPQLVNDITGEEPIPGRHQCAGSVQGPAVWRALVVGAQSPTVYAAEDLTVLQWLADHLTIGLCHQRLAESVSQAAVERERAVAIDSSMELLRTISCVLDIRTVFSQISGIANKMLAHDCLTMSFHDRDGTMLIQAASTAEFPDMKRIVKSNGSHPLEPFLIVPDFATATVSIVEPRGFRETVLAAGFRSLLTVQTDAAAQTIDLEFWSKTPVDSPWPMFRWLSASQPCRRGRVPRAAGE